MLTNGSRAVKRRLERLGAEHLPGYHAAARKAREIVFPALAKGDDLIKIRMRDLVLEVPPELFPVYLHRDYEPLTTRAVLAALRSSLEQWRLTWERTLVTSPVSPRSPWDHAAWYMQSTNVVVHPVAARCSR